MSDFDPIRVLGCMSGTSVDGVDTAEILTDGADIITFGAVGYQAYSSRQRAAIRAAFGTWPGDPALKAATAAVEEGHRVALAGAGGVDLIGFHGQTVAHDPDGGRTHQTGDPAALAAKCPVVWDFRSADMATGGVGAPLAPFFHHALARRSKLSGPVAFVNIGGVANVTFADPHIDVPEAQGAVVAFDCGPGNALVDDFIYQRRGRAFDENGALAAAGTVDAGIVAAVLRDPFFAAAGPKALDRDHFSGTAALTDLMSDEDGAATLTALTAQAVAMSARLMPQTPERWLICGGGRRNATLMRMIADLVDGDVAPVEALGYDGDALEAQAFAWLAVRVLRGLPLSAPGTTGCGAPTTGGRIYYPQ